jgi:hypothetical protein
MSQMGPIRNGPESWLISNAALGDGRGTSGLGLAFRLLAIRVNRVTESTESTLFLMGCGWQPLARLPPALLFAAGKDPLMQYKLGL